MIEIRQWLKDNILLLDGATGTYLAGTTQRPAESCEMENLRSPESVAAAHRAYMDAGSNAISTNTFCANRMNYPAEMCGKLIETGWKIAEAAAGDRAYVFADIGPIRVTDEEDGEAEYRFVADCFLALGAKNFLFETHESDEYLAATAAYIKEKCPDAFILVSFAALADGFTAGGRYAVDMIRKLQNCEAIDAAGYNCVTGARHMVDLLEMTGETEKYFSAMPNAGYPIVTGNRTKYEGSPAYFGQQLRELASRGAKILGGCCGTTPAHIAAAAGALKSGEIHRVTVGMKPAAEKPKAERNEFYEKLEKGEKKVIAVELDPPEIADLSKFMSGSRQLKDAGADIITIADCPIARARMDSSLLACKLKRELGMEALPHMTCRDRNINATKALLLGLCAEGIHNVLTITGDPIPSASRDEVKSVYNFNSRRMAKYITTLGENVLPTPFHVFGALNLNAVNFKIQLGLAKQKEESGICGFLTQPVLTPEALENLKLARAELKGKILGGIIPVVSQRNALFMNSEVSGITVDQKIIDLYEGADRAKGEELAVEISARIAEEIAPYIDGYYLMTPFGRTGLMVHIMQAIREQENRA